MNKLLHLVPALVAAMVVFGPSITLAGYADAVLADPDLIAYYRLNETSGTTAIDAGSNSLNATYYGSIPGDNMAGPSASNGSFTELEASNTAPSFNEDSIALSDTAFDLEEITLACFFKNSDLNKNHRLYSTKFGNAHPLVVVLGGSPDEDPAYINSLDVGVNSGLAAYGSFSDDPLLTDGEWHHLIVVRHADAYVVGDVDVDVYIDGVPSFTGDFSEGHSITGLTTRLGNREEGAFGYNIPWLGGIDEVAFFARAFTTEEALTLYAATGGPITYYVIPGDTDHDGDVDSDDAATLAANWLSQDEVTWEKGDFNDDGIVNDVDATIMAANWTTSTASVPEPAVWTLLLMGTAFAVFIRGMRCKE